MSKANKTKPNKHMTEVCIKLSQGWHPKGFDAEKTVEKIKRGEDDLNLYEGQSGYLARGEDSWEFRLRINTSSEEYNKLRNDEKNLPLSAKLQGGINFEAEQSIVSSIDYDGENFVEIKISCYEMRIFTDEKQSNKNNIRVMKMMFPYRFSLGFGNFNITNKTETITSYSGQHFIFDGANRYFLIRNDKSSSEWFFIISPSNEENPEVYLGDELWADMVGLYFLMGGVPKFSQMFEIDSQLMVVSEDFKYAFRKSSQSTMPTFKWFENHVYPVFKTISEALRDEKNGKGLRIAYNRYIQAKETSYVVQSALTLFMIAASLDKENPFEGNIDLVFDKLIDKYNMSLPEELPDLLSRFHNLVVMGDSHELAEWASVSCAKKETFHDGVTCFRSFHTLIGTMLLREAGYSGPVWPQKHGNPLNWNFNTPSEFDEEVIIFHADGSMDPDDALKDWSHIIENWDWKKSPRTEVISEFLNEIEFSTAGKLFGIIVPRFGHSEETDLRLDVRLVVTRNPATQGTLFSINDSGDKTEIHGWSKEVLYISSPAEMREFCLEFRRSDMFRRQLNRFLVNANTLEIAETILDRTSRAKGNDTHGKH